MLPHNEQRNLSWIGAKSASKQWPMLAVLLFAGIIMFFDLGSYRALASHEVFVAVPAREMVSSGDWLVPRFGGLPRLQKPPLAYWVVAAFGSLWGEVNSWTVRLPTALASFSLVIMVGWWVSKRYGRTAGIAAALAQSSSLFVINFGRKAEVDMIICVLTTAIMLLLIEEPETERSRSSRLRWVAIYALLGLTWLAKFHFALTLIAPTLVVWIFQRRYRAFSKLLNPLGLTIFAACIFVWPMLVVRQVPEASTIWSRETVGRALGEFGVEPFWYYIPKLLLMTLPWGIVAIRALPESWKAVWKSRDSRELWLWAWLILPLIPLSSIPTKHDNYLIPVLPVVSIFAGRAISTLLPRIRFDRHVASRRMVISTTTSVIALLAGACVLVPYRYPFLSTWTWITAGTLTTTAIVGLLLLLSSRPKFAGCVLLSGIACSYVFVVGWMIPACDYRLPDVAFSKQVRQIVADNEIIVYRFTQAHSGMDPMVFYLNEPVSRSESQEHLRRKLKNSGRLHVISYISRLWELDELGNCKRIIHMVPDDSIRPMKHPPLYLVELTLEQSRDHLAAAN